MTIWTLRIESESCDDDSLIMKLMQRAAQLSLKYTVSSIHKEKAKEPPIEGKAR